MFCLNPKNTICRLWLIIAVIAALATTTVYAQPAADEPTPEPETTTEPAPAVEEPASVLPEGVAGIIVEVNGDNAQYTTDNETWQAAEEGTELSVDSSIRTGFASDCSVQMGNNSVLRIEALSSLKMADYVTDAGHETVRANLQYGAVRCGVSHSNITTDTAISTPVSTLSIRGTDVFVEYDPGTRQVMFRVDHDGPAQAQQRLTIPGLEGGPLQYIASEGGDGEAVGRTYQLEEGMATDGNLSRHLGLETQDRTSWGYANGKVGDVSQLESLAIAFQTAGYIDPTEGFGQYLSGQYRDRQQPTGPIFDDPRSGGSGDNNSECPVCPHDY